MPVSLREALAPGTWKLRPRRSRVALLVVLLLVVFVPAAGAWTWPVEGPVVQGFSFDHAHPYAAGQHRGVDIGAASGASVLAPAAGVVSFAGNVPSSGKSLTIETPGGLSVTLTHLGSIAVARDAAVVEGAVVGTIGPSGTPEVDGTYVHLGIRTTADDQGYLDPLGLLPALGAPFSPPAPVAPPAAAAAAAPPAPVPPPAAVAPPAVAPPPAGPLATPATSPPPVATVAPVAADPPARPQPAPGAGSPATGAPVTAPPVETAPSAVPEVVAAAPAVAPPATVAPPVSTRAAAAATTSGKPASERSALGRRAAPFVRGGVDAPAGQAPPAPRSAAQPKQSVALAGGREPAFATPSRAAATLRGVELTPFVGATVERPTGKRGRPPTQRPTTIERAERVVAAAPVGQSHAGTAAAVHATGSHLTFVLAALAVVLGFVLALVFGGLGARGWVAARIIRSPSPTSEGARPVAVTAEDPRRAGLAVREWAAPYRPRGGLRRAGGRVRALPPLEGQRRADGQRHGRARHAGDGGRRPERRIPA
jgi:hypothetical protein